MPPLHRSERQTKQDQPKRPPAVAAPSVFDDALSGLKTGNVAAPDPEPPDDAERTPEVTEATLKAVRRQVHDLYVGTPHVGYSHDLNGKHVQRLVAVLRGVAKKRREALSATVERTVRGFLADRYWQAARWPLNGLVSQAAKYGDPPTDADLAAVAVVDKGQLEFQIASIESKIRTAQTDLQLAKSAGTEPERVMRIENAIATMRGDLKAAQARMAR